MNRLYPIFLKLEALHVLVIGGGNVGLEKLDTLIKNSPEATITLVAKFIKDEIKELAQKHTGVMLVSRNFDYNDLNGKDVVILATDNKTLHLEIKRSCEERHLLCNVADTPELCDFYLGSVIQKGDIKIGISTNGKSPTLAKRMREFFEEAFPDSTQELLEKLKNYRDTLICDFQHKIDKLNSLTNTAFKK